MYQEGKHTTKEKFLQFFCVGHTDDKYVERERVLKSEQIICRFEIFTVVKIQVEVLWVVTL